VGVLLGNGDGTFQAVTTYSSGGEGPASVAVADVNGDGKPDVVVAHNITSNVGVLLGNGDGTFQAAVAYDSPLTNYAAVVADVNGDTKPDIVVVGQGNSVGDVGVLLGNGDGTFQTAVVYGSGANVASSVAVADVNGDNNPDLITANQFDDEVGVLLGNGDGTFGTAFTYSSGVSGPFSVAVADLNGDGKADLVVTNCNSSACAVEGAVDVLINTSTNPTSTALTSSLNPSNPGQSVKFTATVTSPNPGTATGTVNFLDGTTNIGNAALNGSGVAGLTISTLAVGTHSITATYSGDTNFAPGSSSVVSQVVQGALVALSPTSLDFGSQVVPTTSSAQPVTLTNTGNIALSITSIGLTGANSSEFGRTNNCPGSLAANGNCTINVTFTPTAAGSANAALSVADSAPGSPQSVSLTGVGDAAVVSLSPSSVTFSSQYLGTSGLPQTVTVTNTGDAALTISNVSTSVADFGTLSNCTNTVQPGMNCTIGVFFDPTASGTRTGNLLITDNVSGSPRKVTLSGTGQDFSMAPSGSSSATVSPGGTANYKVSVSPGGGFNQTVTFTCSGAPSQSTCSLSPTSIALSGSSAASVTVTLTTAGTSAGLVYPDGLPPASNRLSLWLGLSGLSGLILLGSSGDRSRKWHAGFFYGLAFLCLFSLGITWSACGSGSGSGTGGNGGGTPAGTYNVMVTGTFSSGATTLTHNTKLTLVVQ
jgi:Bacterial Ig-like domain (group 3)/FG-GAP-like repeat/Abnormal spindle-like microcephaly-assoc'd, ASPM-SPD-2-Hydin